MADYKYTLRKGKLVERTNSVDRKVKLEFDGYKLEQPAAEEKAPKAGAAEKSVVRH